ncbi:hypothetical protein H311_01023 [Anncaliia algerae PRA109]|nr:hypothetical protein H311_01023 [Anncaliia algerae PRA109]
MFIKWIILRYNIANIETKENSRNYYKYYLQRFGSSELGRDKDILSVFLKIFSSENYKILYHIIPGFSLIRRIMERKKNKVILIQII